MTPRQRTTLVLSALAAALGLTCVVVTVANGGGPLARGVLLGAMLAAIGGMRMYLVLHGSAAAAPDREDDR